MEGSGGVKFVQIIEFRTGRIDEFNALLDEWLVESKGWRTPTRALQCRDRDTSDTYVNIVEFPSHEEAMENSNRPETAGFAERLSKLCEAPPTFRNFDVFREEDL